MNLDNYHEIFCEDTPLLDVRAPVEFSRGAFPSAVNLPLLDDSEREAVGIEYKRRGNAAAVALGERLVSGQRRERRMARWLEFAYRHPDGALYCFRGGQRSAIVQQWLSEAGVDYPRVTGGYRALRRFLMDQMNRLCESHQLLLLAGRAGSGKTHLLNQWIENSVDLEGLAHHRGSAFGRRPAGQPTPIDFENRISVQWLKLDATGATSVVMEDESRTIGRLALPQPLWHQFQSARLVVVKARFSDRVDQILNDYVRANLAEFEGEDEANGFERFAEHLLESLGRVHRRVGGLRYRALQTIMLEALDAQRATGDVSGHRHWIAPLLRDYYDPMYDYQLAKKRDRVVVEGTRGQVLKYLKQAMPSREAAHGIR